MNHILKKINKLTTDRIKLLREMKYVIFLSLIGVLNAQNAECRIYPNDCTEYWLNGKLVIRFTEKQDHAFMMGEINEIKNEA